MNVWPTRRRSSATHLLDRSQRWRERAVSCADSASSRRRPSSHCWRALSSITRLVPVLGRPRTRASGHQRSPALRDDRLAELVARPREGEGGVRVQALELVRAPRAADADVELRPELALLRVGAREARPKRRASEAASRTSARRRRRPRAARSPPRARGRSGSRSSGTACRPASNAACSVTAGKPCGQRTATRRNGGGPPELPGDHPPSSIRSSYPRPRRRPGARASSVEPVTMKSRSPGLTSPSLRA